MYSFFIFLLPCFFGLKIITHLTKQNKIFDLLLSYGLLVLFSNMFSILILMIFDKGEYNLISYANSNYIFCFKYICLMLVANVFFSILFVIFEKYFVFDVEVKNEKKKNIKNN